jgi:hypothetical protein
MPANLTDEQKDSIIKMIRDERDSHEISEKTGGQAQ